MIGKPQSTAGPLSAGEAEALDLLQEEVNRVLSLQTLRGEHGSELAALSTWSVQNCDNHPAEE